MAFVVDTFTGIAGTNLEAHVGEVGATWTRQNGAAGDGLLTGGGFVYSGSGAPGTAETFWTASGTPPSASYDVQADFKFINETNLPNLYTLVGRWSDINNFYRIYYCAFLCSPHKWVMEKVVAGVTTGLGGSNLAFPTGTTKTVLVRFRTAGSPRIELLVDGVSTITSNDSALTNAGVVGLGMSPTNGSNPANNIQIGNFSATDRGGGIIPVNLEAQMQQIAGGIRG